jgi:thiamine kinase-like enzyme
MPTAGDIIALLEPRLGPVTAGPEALHGGITNHNFQLRFGDREAFLRIPGKDTELLGINRESERLAAEHAAALGIAPSLLEAGENHLVTELIDGGPIDNELLRAHPESAARALRAFHDSELQLPVRFWVPDLLERYADIVAERGRSLPAAYARTQELTKAIAHVLPLVAPAPCHNDLLPGNVLARRAQPTEAVLVDWEYAGMGHRLFDLGNLAVNNEFDDAAEEKLLAAYFPDGVLASRRAALKLMRIMSDAREAAWGVVQGTISDLQFDFGAYADKHFARLTAAADDPRLPQWLHGATA